jgi:hypothetical protein
MDPYNFMELGFDVKEHTKEFYETWRYWALRRNDNISQIINLWIMFTKNQPKSLSILKEIDII